VVLFVSFLFLVDILKTNRFLRFDRTSKSNFVCNSAIGIMEGVSENNGVGVGMIAGGRSIRDSVDEQDSTLHEEDKMAQYQMLQKLLYKQ
jgi:hypothetical protein